MTRLASTLAALPLSLLVACGGSSGGAPDAGSAPDAEPTPETGEVCGSLHAAFDPIVPTVMLVVDRSGSMRLDYGGQTRWDALYQTLMAPGTGVVTQLADRVRFGMMLYTGNEGQDTGTCPTLVDVAPALDNHAAIDAMYAATEPGHGTPTGAAMAAATPLLAATQADGPKILILATDGEPDTCGAPSQDLSPEARAAVLDAVGAAYADDMKTYVISVGADISAAHLQEVANAGVGLAQNGQEQAPYYVAEDTAALVEAFDTIIDGARGCLFDLDAPIDGRVLGGTVTLDGVELERGVDWELRNGTSIELLGEACDTVLAGGSHVVEATITCDMPTVE